MKLRKLPNHIEGYGKVFAYKSSNKIIDKAEERNKNTSMGSKLTDLDQALESVGLSDGMTISFHHHLRNGDHVMKLVLDTIHRAGIRDLTLSASSISKVHDCLLSYVKDGTITKIYTSGLRGELANEIQTNFPLKSPVVFMTHGGRARAIEAGDIDIDVAFVAASSADERGNINGMEGKSAFGAIGYPMIDVKYSKASVAITDNIVEHSKASIPGDYIDHVVLVDSIGDPSLIATGSTRMSNKPMDLLIAKKAADAIIASGVVEEGFAFQAGSGAISLAVCRFIKEYMMNRDIVGSFAMGGVTQDLVCLLQDGMFKKLYDVQTFGEKAVSSLKDNDNHIEISASEYANPNNENCLVNKLDVMILSATEIDLDFNINSVTGSNGKMMGALGGAPDTASVSKLTVVVAPSMRKRIPIVVDEVMTISTPGEFVDVLVTERGICVNPNRSDLMELFHDAGIKIKDIKVLRDEIHHITGTPDDVQMGSQIVGVIEYRDGTVLDVIYNR